MSARLVTHLGTDDDPEAIRWPVPLVQVIWEDATSDDEWNDVNELRDYRDIRSWRVIEVGFLLERTHGRRGYFLIASSIHPGSEALRPKVGMVRKIPSQWATVRTLGIMEQDGTFRTRRG